MNLQWDQHVNHHITEKRSILGEPIESLEDQVDEALLPLLQDLYQLLLERIPDEV